MTRGSSARQGGPVPRFDFISPRQRRVQTGPSHWRLANSREWGAIRLPPVAEPACRVAVWCKRRDADQRHNRNFKGAWAIATHTYIWDRPLCGGQRGWPDSFAAPKNFAERAAALRPTRQANRNRRVCGNHGGLSTQRARSRSFH